MLALLCCLLHLHTTTSASLPVPLLTWTTKLQEKPVYVTSGHSEGLEALFKAHVEPSLTAGHLTLVFLQDELSSDDFVKYAESFPHLQKIMETQKNTFFPAGNILFRNWCDTYFIRANFSDFAYFFGR